MYEYIYIDRTWSYVKIHMQKKYGTEYTTMCISRSMSIYSYIHPLYWKDTYEPDISNC